MAIITTSLTIFLAVLPLLLPGYAWILVSGLHKRISTLEKVVLSFLLGICFSSLVAAALTFLTTDYLFTSVVISVVSALLVIGGYLIRRYPSLAKEHRVSLSTGSRAVDFSILAYAILILALFWSAPYYPTAQAPDLLTHTAITNAIIAGQGRSTLLHSDFPIGLHFLAAIVSSLGDVGALAALRDVASAALLATVPLVFLSAREVLGTTKAAGMAVLVAAFVLPANALHLVRIGTFPNLMSDMFVLATVWLTFRYARQPNRSLGLTLTILGVGGTFMHSSFLILLAVLWIAVPFAYLLYRAAVRLFATAAAYSTLGLALFASLAFFSFQANLERLAQSYIVVGGTTVFRIALDEFTRSVLTFLGIVNVAALICAGVFALKFRSGLGSVFSFLWLLLMIPGALFSGQAYRFILFAMLPGSYLAGHMLANAPSRLDSAGGTRLANLTRTVQAVILLLLIVSGAFPSIVSESFNPSGRNYQSAVYDSMIWVQHSSCNVGVASIGLWPDYEYLPALTGVPYMGDFIRTPEYLLQKSAILGFHCLVASRNNRYFHQFEVDTSFREEYRNELVTVFAIV
jgi:hypothetical protein